MWTEPAPVVDLLRQHGYAVEQWGRLGWALTDPEGCYVLIDGRVLAPRGRAIGAALECICAQRQ